MTYNYFHYASEVLIAFIAYGGSFIFGVSLGWSSPAAPTIQSDDFAFKVNKTEFAFIVGLMALGASISTIVTGIIRKKYGTKLTVVIVGIPTTFGWLLMIFAENSAMLMIGRFLSGFAAGAYGILLPLYVGEISSKEIRGTLLTFHQIVLNFGEIFVFTFGFLTSYTTLNIVCSMIPVIYCILFYTLLPESPVYLIVNDKENEARNVIKKLRGNEILNIDKEVDDIRGVHTSSNNELNFFGHLRQKPTRKAFFIVLIQFFFFQFTGSNAILFYTTTIFEEANLKMSSGLASIIVVSSQIIGTSISSILVDRVGRRIMLMTSAVLMAISHACLGTYFLLKNAELIGSNMSFIPIVSLCFYEVAFGSGIGPVSYVLLGEIFTPVAKNFIAPFGKGFNLFLAFIIGLIFPILVDEVGISATFFFFFGFSILSFLYTYFIIPETKGKSFSEIQKLLS